MSLAPVATQAQQQTMPRVGVLTFTQITPSLQSALRSGLRDHGYVEGRNIAIEWRAAEGSVERGRALAQDLVRLKPDVIVAMLTPAVQAAKDASGTIPIVMAPAGDPLSTGFVASLARPGGNITGIAGQGAELSGKRIELLRELIPGIRALGVLTNGADPFATSFIDEHRIAAKKAGIELHIVDVRRPEDVDRALASMVRERAGAVIVQGVLTGQNWQVGPLAARHRLPSTSNLRQFAEAGGLFSYGASFAGIWRRAASYVDRILKGAKAAELPVEQPTQFELVINLKAAKTLGLAIPPSILVRADHVIQ